MKKQTSLLIQFMGENPLVRIIDFMLENKPFDASKTEIAAGAQISRMSLFKHWDKLERYGIVKVSRRYGNTKLYKINSDNPIVKRVADLEFALIRVAMEQQKTVHKVQYHRLAVPA